MAEYHQPLLEPGGGGQIPQHVLVRMTVLKGQTLISDGLSIATSSFRHPNYLLVHLRWFQRPQEIQGAGISKTAGAQ